MHLNALLDVDVVAVETEDELSILLDLQAPTPQGAVARPPRTLQIVLDRSGSMSGGRLDAALRGLEQLVDRLDAQDRFGVVAFDHEVHVVVPCAPLGDGHAARHALRRVVAGGSTNLSAGLLRGLEQARDAKGEGGATLLLLSDGHANDGVRDPERLGQLARGARTDGVTVGVIGIGLGYDEEVLGALAAGGAGDVHFAEQADATIGALTAEVDGLLDQVVQAASLTVTPSSAVRSVRLYNDLPVSETDAGFTVELGDFTAGETRRLLLRADVPALADLGLEAVCELRLRWTELATMTTRTLDLPVHVNVVPGDEAAGRVPDPKVRTEFAYQQAQKARKAATDAMRRGDRDAAHRLLDDAADDLQAAAAEAPAFLLDDLRGEVQELQLAASEALTEDLGRAAKQSAAAYNAKALKRRWAEEQARRAEADGDAGAGEAGEGA